MNLQEATILAIQNKLIETNNSLAQDYIEVTDVYNICMDTYGGKKLYLAQTNPYVKDWRKAKSLQWVFDPNIAIRFSYEIEARQFAEKYFKHFDKWYIHKATIYY